LLKEHQGTNQHPIFHNFAVTDAMDRNHRNTDGFPRGWKPHPTAGVGRLHSVAAYNLVTGRDHLLEIKSKVRKTSEPGGRFVFDRFR
jgi:hypothetical protein